MSAPFEQWAKAEISKLRAEADTLERALTKYLESQSGESSAAKVKANGSDHPRPPNRSKNLLGKRGEKNITVLRAMRDAGSVGATTDELFEVVTAKYPEMKRSTLRALLWHEKQNKLVEVTGLGRYALTQEGIRMLP